MPGALVGVASCARCGSLQNSTGALCRSCGTVLTPAAQGSVLGTYTPLLAGVARSSAVRGYLAGLIDMVPAGGGSSGCWRPSRLWRVRNGGLDWLAGRRFCRGTAAAASSAAGALSGGSSSTFGPWTT